MRTYSTCLVAVMFLFGFLTAAFSQELQKESIAVLPSRGWAQAEAYQNAFVDKVATLIIQSRRFNVIDRANIDKIAREQALQMSGFIDLNTVVEFGKVIGVQKILDVGFTQSSVDFHKKKYKVYDEQKGKEVKVANSYYSATVSVSIQMIDVESGRYLEAAEASGNGKGTNENSALAKALDDVATNVVEAFFQYFAIHGFIESIDKSNAIIDRGNSEGITRLMDFEILNLTKSDLLKIGTLSISTDTERVGLLKIVAAERNSARGRLIGDHSAVHEGHLIREVKEDLPLEATILEKRGGRVVIDMGSDVDVKKGATFNVVRSGDQYVNPITGESFGTAEKLKGKIYVSQVQPRFSRGKILGGRYTIKEGMVLRETTPWRSNYMASASFALYTMEAKVNTNPWKGTIENKYVESKIDSVDYRGREDVTSGTMVKMQFGKWNEVKGLSYALGVGHFQINDELSAFSMDFSVLKHIGIIPELLYCYAGGGIGFASARQSLKPEIIHHLTKGDKDRVMSMASQYHGTFGVRLQISNLNIFGEVDYTFLTFDDWSYGVKYQDEEGYDRYDSINIMKNLLPYPKLSMSGPYFRIGAWYNIKGLTRLFWIF